MVATFPPVTSSAVVELLRARYPAPAWAFLEQVGNGTGMNASRHADALAMSLWPSRGLELVGFEVKVSRNDWRRELLKPDKAEEIASRCDRWFVVAPADIVPLADVPAAWGLLEVVGGKRVIQRKDADRLDAKPLDRSFLAAILRKASATSPTLEMQRQAHAEAREAARADVDRLVRIDTSRLSGALESLKSRVEAFEAATGITLERHGERTDFYGFPSGEALGKAVMYLAKGGPGRVHREIRSIEGVISRLQETVAEAGQLAPEMADTHAF